nr:hypothetical protein [uncultured Actinoplanes sp.]
MNAVVRYASLICVAAGLVCGTLALVRARDVRVALRVALDFWLAAGMLRLALPSALRELLGTAVIIAVRQIVGQALRSPAAGPRSASRRPPPSP